MSKNVNFCRETFLLGSHFTARHFGRLSTEPLAVFSSAIVDSDWTRDLSLDQSYLIIIGLARICLGPEIKLLFTSCDSPIATIDRKKSTDLFFS